MNMLILLPVLFVLGVIAVGFYLDRNPLQPAHARRWTAPTLLGGILGFLLLQIGATVLGLQEALASTGEALANGNGVSMAHALAIVGIGIPTAVSTVAAAMAVGPIGAAALATVAEKPELFGRTLVYLGLAEGIAIYGLVLSILLLDKI